MKPPTVTPGQAVLSCFAAGTLGITVSRYTDVMLHISTYAACAGTWAFVAFYASRVQWEKSLTGWNMMTVAVGLASLTTVGAARRLLGPDADLLATMAYCLVAVASVWTVLTINRVQREGTGRAPRVEPNTMLHAEPREGDVTRKTRDPAS